MIFPERLKLFNPMAGKLAKNGFIDFVYDLYLNVKKQEIELIYEGEINHHLVKAFTGISEGILLKTKEPSTLQKTVYHVIVESLQNISKHAANPDSEKDKGINRGIFLLSKTEDAYNITTGNVIKKENIRYLSEKIGQLNSLTEKELNEIHKKQLSEGHISERGGAGLGLIDIRRKTGNELDFRFLPFSDTHAYFLITSTIQRN